MSVLFWVRRAVQIQTDKVGIGAEGETSEKEDNREDKIEQRSRKRESQTMSQSSSSAQQNCKGMHCRQHSTP